MHTIMSDSALCRNGKQRLNLQVQSVPMYSVESIAFITNFYIGGPLLSYLCITNFQV